MLRLHLLFFVIKFISCDESYENNVCPTLDDYYTIKYNPKCWYDYDATHTVPEIIKNAGRPYEEHKVTTIDGYILTLFRIPNKSLFRKTYPVLLQHGLILSAGTWTGIGNQSAAFELHNRGFDVWLGNTRGTEYATEHETLPIGEDYWDFSVDDIALSDLPAMLKYIKRETSEKITYVGHSLGCSIAIMYSSEYPKQAKKYLKSLYLAAPAYNLIHHHSLLRIPAYFSNFIYYAAKDLGMVKLLSHWKTTQTIAAAICKNSPVQLEQCFSVLTKYNAVTPDRYPQVLNLLPAGSSLKVLKHFADLMFSKFRKFNYGTILNILHYGRFSPPVYKPSKIKVPTYIIYAKMDWITPMEGALDLYNDLSEEVRLGIYQIPSKYFSHLDFVSGSTSKILFVDPLVEHIEDHI